MVEKAERRAVREMSGLTLGVVIPCFNDGHFLVEAMASLDRSATLVDQIVVVDDGSTDAATLTVLDELNGCEVVRQANQGLAVARNTGIARLQTDLVLPLDADNLVRPGYMTESKAVFDCHPGIGVVYSDRQEFGDKDRYVKVGGFDPLRLIAGNYIDACAVYRKCVWDQIGGYDAGMPRQGHEDWDFWLSVASTEWGFHYVPQALFDYRVRGDSMSIGMRQEMNVVYQYVMGKHQEFIRRTCRDASRRIARGTTRASLLHRIRRRVWR